MIPLALTEIEALHQAGHGESSSSGGVGATTAAPRPASTEALPSPF